ncbi:hypothetical protein SH467x_000857 [Pirellulaceae bacterium SH467]|jgi:hypothetical protein
MSTYPITPSPDLNTGSSASAIQSLPKPIRSWLVRALFVGGFVLSLVVYKTWIESRLGNESFATGYVLSFTCLGLCALGIRKRLYGFSLGPVASWQSAHHFLGILCLFAYCLHAGFITNGWLESILAILFWVILATGMISWYINKRGPRLLQAAGKAILPSDIPNAKNEVMDRAYHVALRSAGNTRSSAIADLYRNRLEDFFRKPRSLWYRVSPHGRGRRRLLAELDRLSRYLDPVGLELRREMQSCIEKRDDLDFQEAIQQRIRFWAAFHSCLLGAFLVVAVFHVILAHFFSSHW